jgi:hypothetical protein
MRGKERRQVTVLAVIQFRGIDALANKQQLQLSLTTYM